jgi:hypothetical protein
MPPPHTLQRQVDFIREVAYPVGFSLQRLVEDEMAYLYYDDKWGYYVHPPWEKTKNVSRTAWKPSYRVPKTSWYDPDVWELTYNIERNYRKYWCRVNGAKCRALNLRWSGTLLHGKKRDPVQAIRLTKALYDQRKYRLAASSYTFYRKFDEYVEEHLQEEVIRPVSAEWEENRLWAHKLPREQYVGSRVVVGKNHFEIRYGKSIYAIEYDKPDFKNHVATYLTHAMKGLSPSDCWKDCL